MHHPILMLSDGLAVVLESTFAQTFGTRASQYGEMIGSAARLVMERLALSDALYHDAEHTALVALVAQDILRGRRLRRDVSADMWMHVMLAALTHDIGYVRGACGGDRPDSFVIDEEGNVITLPRGASDAALAPHHIERSKIAVRERFLSHALVDGERLARAIELTRFPMPAPVNGSVADPEAGIVQAADLIGQLGDPLYLTKLNALFHEFAEIGLNDQLGYHSPADLAERYPSFFWSKVEPFIGHAVRDLEMTIEGRAWLGHLYAHVCVTEHHRQTLGPAIDRVELSRFEQSSGLQHA